MCDFWCLLVVANGNFRQQDIRFVIQESIYSLHVFVYAVALILSPFSLFSNTQTSERNVT